MCPGRGNLECSPRPLLAAHVPEIGHLGRFEHFRRERLERGRVDLSPEVGDGFAEAAHGNGLDARQSGLRRRLGGAHDEAKPGASGTFRDGQRARDRPDASVEPELTDRRVIRQPLGRKLSRRSEHRQRDREIEP